MLPSIYVKCLQKHLWRTNDQAKWKETLGDATSLQTKSPCSPARLPAPLLQTQLHKTSPPHCLNTQHHCPTPRPWQCRGRGRGCSRRSPLENRNWGRKGAGVGKMRPEVPRRVHDPPQEPHVGVPDMMSLTGTILTGVPKAGQTP